MDIDIEFMTKKPTALCTVKGVSISSGNKLHCHHKLILPKKNRIRYECTQQNGDCCVERFICCWTAVRGGSRCAPDRV